MCSGSIRRIPEEIYLEILFRLPAKSILKCKSVCKSWFSLISKPSFIKLHLDFTLQTKNKSSRCTSLMLGGHHNDIIYSLVYDESSPSLSEIEDYVVEISDYPFKSPGFYVVALVGSCNGIICLRLYGSVMFGETKDFFCLWNPVTKEFKEIPKSPGCAHEISAHALGYDSLNGEYKLLLLADNGKCGSVYTSGTNAWKSILSVPYYWLPSLTAGVLVNGVPHWLVLKEKQFIVVCLDVSNEKFKEMQIPRELSDVLVSELADNITSLNGITDGVLEGCFSLLVLVEEVGVQVWVMQDPGDRESWTKRYTITNESVINLRCLKIRCNFKNDKILFVDSGRFILYDLKHGSANERRLTNLVGVSSETKYLETLVSLNSGTFAGSRQILESVETRIARMLRRIQEGASLEIDQ